MILPAGDIRSSTALAERIGVELGLLEAEAVGKLSVSTGIAIGPENAANPRELVACAEAAMMTAKARGKGLVVPFDESARERPDEERIRRDDVRSIAHLKMLQSLSGKLSRLNDVEQIGLAMADELRLLIDYHNCRVFLREDDDLVPVAFRGDLITAEPGDPVNLLPTQVGRGITGWVAGKGEPLLVGDAANHEFGERDRRHGRHRGVAPRRPAQIRATRDRRHRHLEARTRPVRRRRPPAARGDGRARFRRARERAALQAQRREAESAKALLEFSRDLAEASGIAEVAERVASGAVEHPREHGHVGLAPERETARWRSSASDEPAAERVSRIPAEHLAQWLGRHQP